MDNMNNMTNSQLLARLMGHKACEVAEDVMCECDNKLITLERYIDILDAPRFSKSKKDLLKCLFELANRINDERNTDANNMIIDTPNKIFELFNSYMSRIDQEEFWVIYMSRSGKLLHKERLNKGTNSACLVDGRTIIIHALAINASYVGLCHNHPHSSLNPSKIDKDLTERIKKMLEIMDIRLIDHIIISDNKYYSFCDEGLI